MYSPVAGRRLHATVSYNSYSFPDTFLRYVPVSGVGHVLLPHEDCFLPVPLAYLTWENIEELAFQHLVERARERGER